MRGCQKGVALLVALLVVALATVLIAGLLDHGQLAMARTRNQLRADQADAYARGLEAYAAKVLIQDMDNGAIDARDDMWAVPLPPTPVPGGTIRATLVEMNGCFNLNNLVQNDQPKLVWVERFRRLLLNLQLSPDIADASVDWIDSNAVPETRGAEDAAYAARTPAYRAANRPFTDVSELRLVAGVDVHAWDVLSPFVCVLPTTTTLNLNTASEPLLMSLASGITAPPAARLYQKGRAHWQSVPEAMAELRKAGVQIRPDEEAGLSVSSTYFLASARIRLDDIDFVHHSLLQREAGVRVLMRDLGE